MIPGAVFPFLNMTDQWLRLLSEVNFTFARFVRGRWCDGGLTNDEPSFRWATQDGVFGEMRCRTARNHDHLVRATVTNRLVTEQSNLFELPREGEN